MEGDNAEFDLTGQDTANNKSFAIGQKYDGPLVFCNDDAEIVAEIASSAYIGSGTHITPDKNGGKFLHVNQFMPGMWGVRGFWDANNVIKYCGVSFDEEGGDKVYGWIKIQRLSISSGKIIDWAYDTTGASIPAGYTGPVPEPATGLALLALGAAGIAAYRRR